SRSRTSSSASTTRGLAGIIELEVGQHDADAPVVGRLRRYELHEDAVDVPLDGRLLETEAPRDACVRTARGHQPEHVVLPRAQPVEPVSARREFPDERLLDDRAPGTDARERLEEAVDLDDAALQQVADARTVPEQIQRTYLYVCREQEDCRPRKLVADDERGIQAFGRVRHLDADDREVGPVLAHEVEKHAGVADPADGWRPDVRSSPGRGRGTPCRGWTAASGRPSAGCCRGRPGLRPCRGCRPRYSSS